MNHQRIKNIRAISFDLDDTLYDNLPVIQKAYFALYNHLITHYPEIKARYNFKSFLEHASEFQIKNKNTVDLSLLRRQHISELLSVSEKNNPKVELAFEVFWKARQNVTLYPGVFNILEALSSKMPLITISNGNASTKAIGIDHFFEFSISTKDINCAKPDPKIFLFACDKLSIKPHQLLHIGDNLNKDVNGAQIAGCRAVWFNNQKMSSSSIDIEFDIASLDELLNFNFI